MDESFSMQGKLADIKKAIAEQFDLEPKEAEMLLQAAYKNHKVLTENGETFEPIQNAQMGTVAGNYTFNINIKATTILMLALILDLAYTKGFAALVTKMLGLPNKTVCRISQTDGESCILNEIVLSKKKICTGRVLEPYHGKCAHPEFRCRFQNSECCSCQSDDVKSILDRLAQEKVLRVVGDGLYQYSGL